MRISSRRKTIIASITRSSKQGKFSGGIVTLPIVRVVLNSLFASQNLFKSSIFFTKVKRDVNVAFL